MVVTVLAGLTLLGWLIRRFVWDRLTRTRLVRTLVPGIETLSERLEIAGTRRRDAVVFAAWPNDRMLTVGVVTGQVASPDGGDPWLAVLLFPTAGQLKGSMLRILDPLLVTYPGWTLEEAMAFVTSLGASSGALTAS